MGITVKIKWNDAAFRVGPKILGKFAEFMKPHEASIGIHEEDGGEAKINDFGQPEDDTLAQVMAAHEFGLGDLPQRSFLRTYFDNNVDRWKREVTKAMRAEAAAAAAKAAGALVSVPRMNSTAGAIEKQTDPVKAWVRKTYRQWRQYIVSGDNFESLTFRRIETKEFFAFRYPERPLQAGGQFVDGWTAKMDGEDVDANLPRSRGPSIASMAKHLPTFKR